MGFTRLFFQTNTIHKLLPFLLLAFLFTSCGEKTVDQKPVPSDFSESITEQQKTVALEFINGYVENANRMGKALETREWVKQNPLVTKSFVKAVTKLIDDAEKADPELGLDFDPIFDAQDYPEEGFQVMQADEKTGYVTVSGKEWTDFKLKLKLIREGQHWLVDGAGVINIPEEERTSR